MERLLSIIRRSVSVAMDSAQAYGMKFFFWSAPVVLGATMFVGPSNPTPTASTDALRAPSSIDSESASAERGNGNSPFRDISAHTRDSSKSTSSNNGSSGVSERGGAGSSPSRANLPNTVPTSGFFGLPVSNKASTNSNSSDSNKPTSNSNTSNANPSASLVLGPSSPSSASSTPSTTTSTSTSSSASTVGGSSPTISLTAPSDRLFPVDATNPPILQGQTSAYTFSPTVSNPWGDTLTYSCTYGTVGLATTDPNYAAAGTACTSLPSFALSGSVKINSTASFSTTTGDLTWWPTDTQRGTYQFTVGVTDQHAGSSTKTFNVTVRENYSTTNLVAAFDGQTAISSTGVGSSSIPSSARLTTSSDNNVTTDWMGLVTGTACSLTDFATSTPWAGTGLYSSPYSIAFNGVSGQDRANLGTIIGSNTKLMFETWIKPTSVATASTVILGNGGGSGNGFVLKQSDTNSGRLELQIGANKSYSQIVLADAPVGYWRLDDVNTTLSDSSGNGKNGTLIGGYTQRAIGSLTGDTNTATAFNGTTGHAEIAYSAALNPSVFTAETWVKVTGGAGTYRAPLTSRDNAAGVQGYQFYAGSGNTWEAWIGNGTGAWTWLNGSAITLNAWTHLVSTYDGATFRFYIDGSLIASTASAFSANGLRPIRIAAGNTDGGAAANFFFPGSVDETAIYNYALTSGQIKAHYDAGQGKFYANAILAGQPKGYWRLDEVNGNVAYDFTQNGNNGTYSSTGVIPNQTGPLASDTNTSTKFNGSSNIDLGSSITIKPTTQISVSAWVKFNTIANGVRFLSDWHQNGSTDRWLFYTSNNTVYWHTANLGEALAVGIPQPGGWSATGTWHHYVGTYSGTQSAFYLDGVLQGTAAITGAMNAGAGATVRFGAQAEAGTPLDGYIDEVAIFDYALSPQQVTNLYNSSTPSKCISKTIFSNSTWRHVAGLWDGTNLGLYVDGQKECQIVPTGTFTSPASSTTYVGAAASSNTNNWAGSIADLKIYAASGATSVGSAATIKSDFDATANRFREKTINGIVSDSLLVNFDAALAKNGISPQAAGCPTGSTTWQDLGPYGLNGGMIGFSACGAIGWSGAGTAASPYVLAGNGGAQMITVPANSAFMPTGNTITLEWWFKSANVAATQIGIDVSGWYRMYLSGGKITADYNTASNVIGSVLPQDPTVLSNNTWYHAVWTYDGTNIKMYLNGTLNKTQAASGALWGMWGAANMTIGGYPTGIYGFNGSIAAARVYSRALSAAEVTQNCRAYQSRFTGSTCN